MQTRVIINPQADNGRCATVLPQIRQTLRRLALDVDIQLTRAPQHATDLAYQSARDGFERVVAAGGDGTCNEVINGLIQAQHEGYASIFGLIPFGSGNDFAYALGIPKNISLACQILTSGSAHPVDLGLVTVDGKARYFCNTVGMGLDGEVVVNLDAARHLRGLAMYLFAAVKGILFGSWPYTMNLAYNNITTSEQLTLVTIANGPRAGGGLLFAPQARIDDGLFDICYARRLSKVGALTLLPLMLRGLHVHHKAVHLEQTKQISITTAGGVPAYVDGDILTTAGRNFQFELAPQQLSVWR